MISSFSILSRNAAADAGAEESSGIRRRIRFAAQGPCGSALRFENRKPRLYGSVIVRPSASVSSVKTVRTLS